MTKKKQQKKIPRKPISPPPGVEIVAIPSWIFPKDLIPDERDEVPMAFRVLDAKGRASLESDMVSLDFMNLPARVISLCWVDENGNRMVSEEDEPSIMKGEYPFTSNVVYALTLTALIINGILPPPDQNVDHGKYVSFESLKGTLQKEYPSWSQKKIEGCMEFMKHLRFAGQVFSFQRSYANKYRPGTEARERLLPAIPSVPEEERADALARLLKRHPKPIHYDRWKQIERYVMRGLVEDARSDGKPVEEVMKGRLLDSLQAAAVTARGNTGIFTPEEELIREFKAAYRREAETDLRIPKETDAFYYRKIEKLSEDPEDEEESGPVEEEELTATGMELHLAELAERLDLSKRFEGLSPQDRETVQVLMEQGGDNRAAAEMLKISEATLRKRLSRIRKEESRRRKSS